MSMTLHRDAHAPSARRSENRMEARLIFAAAFPLFLVARAVQRLAPRGAQAGPSRSVFAQARDDARSATKFAFMG